MKVVRLSALRNGRLYPSGHIPGTHFCKRLSKPQGHSADRRIMSMKNSNDTVGNRTRDFRLVAQCLNQLRHRVSLYSRQRLEFLSWSPCCDRVWNLFSLPRKEHLGPEGWGWGWGCALDDSRLRTGRIERDCTSNALVDDVVFR